MESTLLLTSVPTPEDTGKTIQFPTEHEIDMSSSIAFAKLHSCSSYRFFQNLATTPKTYNDILTLISKYYTPKQTVEEENICTMIDSSTPQTVQCNNIPIPSWKLSSDNETKSYPSLCPYFSQHLTLELLFWILLILFFKMDGPNLGSFVVLFIFYGLIQCMIFLMAYCYKDDFYRYKHIFAVPLYESEERINYFQKIFDNPPTITAHLDLHETESIKKELSIRECATFIEPNISKHISHYDDDGEEEDDNEYLSWFYCVAYETDIDFIDKENRSKFQDLCIDFINGNLDENLAYHSFDIVVTQDLLSAYNKKYWSGNIMIVNAKFGASVDILRFVIKLLNLLCLSLLYKIPLFFVKEKRIKIIKYIGFGA